MSRGQVEAVPLVARQRDVGGARNFEHAVVIHGADDGLHTGGVAQNPRRRDGGLGDVIFGADFAERPVEVGIALVVVHKRALAALERRPRLNGEVVHAAVVKDVAVAVNRAVGVHVRLHAAGNDIGKRDGELDLVGEQLLLHIFFEQLNLRGLVVGHAESAHLALLLQLVKGFGDLLRLHQRVGAVQKQHVEIFGAEPLQNAVNGADDVVIGQVVHNSRHNAALGLQNDLVARNTNFPQAFAEQPLALSPAVDVGMVKKVDAERNAVPQIFGDIPALQLRQPHAAQADNGDF